MLIGANCAWTNTRGQCCVRTNSRVTIRWMPSSATELCLSYPLDYGRVHRMATAFRSGQYLAFFHRQFPRILYYSFNRRPDKRSFCVFHWECATGHVNCSFSQMLAHFHSSMHSSWCRVFVFMRRKLKCFAFFSLSRLHVIHKSQQPTKQTSHIHTHNTTTTVAYYFFTNSWQHHFVNINEIRSNKFYLFKLNCEFYWLTAGYLYLCAIDIFNV